MAVLLVRASSVGACIMLPQRCREPLHAKADRAAWWELIPLASHAHPSVAAMARQLLAGAPVVYNGDPLRDLSLVNFLDAFVQRKPKVCARPAPTCCSSPLRIHSR